MNFIGFNILNRPCFYNGLTTLQQPSQSIAITEQEISDHLPIYLCINKNHKQHITEHKTRTKHINYSKLNMIKNAIIN